MTILKVLIIDDEVVDGDPRLDIYELTKRKLSEMSAVVSFEFDYAENGPDALNKLRNGGYDFAFLDAVLRKRNWLQGVAFAKVCEALSWNGVPFWLVTSKFDDTNRDEVYVAMNSTGYVTLLRWRDLEEIEDSSGFLYATMLQGKKDILAAIELDKGPNDDVTILQISDIQIGGYPDFKDKFEAQVTSKKIHALTGAVAPDFVVLTGDLAEHATPNQFKGASEWLTYLFELIGFPTGPSVRLSVVPGNHDVNLALGAAGHLKYLGKESESVRPGSPSFDVFDDVIASDLIRHAYTPYVDAEKGLTIRSRRLVNSSLGEFRLSWAENAFSAMGLLFFGLNTARPLVSGKSPKRRVSEEELADLTGWLTQNQAATQKAIGVEGFTIGLCHHSPFGDVADKSIENPEMMDKFFSHSGHTSLVFTGHVHSGGFRLRTTENGFGTIVSTGSTATLQSKARDEDSSRGFNFVILKRQNFEVISVECYQFIWSMTGLDPKSKRIFVKRGKTFIDETEGS